MPEKTSAGGRSPPQELEGGPRSGPYLLVTLNVGYTRYMTDKGQDCLWESKEQDCEWTAHLICSSFFYGTRLPLRQRGAKQRIYIPFHSLCCSSLSQRNRSAVQLIFCVAPRCPRDSLVPYKSEQNQFHPILALLGMGAPIKKPITIIQVKNITFHGKLSIEAKNYHKSQRDKSEGSLSRYIKIV